MKTLYFFLIALVIVLVFSTLALGQVPPPPALPGNPPQAPIDGGLSVLALGGAAYAIKKLRGQKTNS